MLDIFPNQSVQREQLLQLKKGTAKTTRKKVTSSQKSSFKESLLEGVSEEFNDRIDNVIDQLESLQEMLLSHPSIGVVEKYRTLIGSFLKELFSQYQSHSFFRGRLGQRVEIKVWHSVNQELESLSQTVLDKNTPGLNILKHLGALKGILLDLKVGRS